MSFYVVHQTIPPNTLRSAPVSVSFEAANPVLSCKSVRFPKNAAMLCGIQVCDRNGIIWPSPGSPSQWITGDFETVLDDSSVRLSGSPFELKIRMYNEDCTYDRAPEIRLTTEDTK